MADKNNQSPKSKKGRDKKGSTMPNDVEDSRAKSYTLSQNEDEEKAFNKVLNIAIGLASIPLLIILAISLVIPILQLAFGANYLGQCPINQNIPIYLIVSGSCGIATILLILVIFGLIICIVKKRTLEASIAAGAIIACLFVFIFLMSFFLFAWFIVGNVWIFSAKSTVQYSNPNASNYCQQNLYDFAFWILITSYIFMVLSCCCNCCQTFIQSGLALKKNRG